MSNATAKIRTPAKSYGKCSCCGEKWHKGERMYILKFEDEKDQKICRFCSEDEHGEVQEYTEAEWTRLIQIEMENDMMSRHERRMEDYGAYRAAGCTDAYWQDRDAGYCS